MNSLILAVEETQFKSKKKEEDDHEDEGSLLFSQAMNLASSIVLPMVMHTALDLGVFEIIAKAGPGGAKMSASDIASHFPSCVNPNAPVMLERLLRLLACHRVLVSSFSGNERVYGLTPVAKFFVPDEDGVSLGSYMDLLHNKSIIQSWFELKGAILEGGVPFDRLHGMHLFEYPNKDPMFGKVFNKAMECHTTIVMKKMLEVYKGFEDIKKLVDVGGGVGITLSLITSRHPHIKGINFDLPRVIQHAPNYLAGVEHVEGDMLQSVPQGDAIFMKWILHDWEDKYCLSILKNCHKAIPQNGKVIVMEANIPVEDKTSVAAKVDTFNMDLLTMTNTINGKERTKEEFMALAKGAGFSGITFSCQVCNFWVMEFNK